MIQLLMSLVIAAVISVTANQLLGLDDNQFLPFLVVVFFTIFILMISSIKIIEYWKSPDFSVKDSALIKETYKKYRYHTFNSKFSLYVLLSMTTISLLIIVFAQYIVVLDRVFSAKTVGVREFYLSGMYDDTPCSILISKIGGEATFGERASSVAAYQECLKRQNEIVSMTGGAEMNNPTSQEKIEPDVFIPVMFLRVSVLAFSLFIIYFFIMNYRYDVSMANRYFSILSSILASEDMSRIVKAHSSSYDTENLKFGPIRSGPLEDLISIPRELIKGRRNKKPMNKPNAAPGEPITD